MSVPDSYNDVDNISMEPGPLQFIADVITSGAEDIASALDTINETLSSLQLGWAGKTASEAQDFASQWIKAMTALFGSSKDPKSGLLNQVAIGLLTAIGNDSGSEESITSMFSQLVNAIPVYNPNATPDNTAAIPPSGTALGATSTAIAEINWWVTP